MVQQGYNSSKVATSGKCEGFDGKNQLGPVSVQWHHPLAMIAKQQQAS